MNAEFDVMAAGHLCFDVIPSIPDTGSKDIAEVLTPGKLVQVGGAKMSTGGPVSNTGIAMKILGNRVCFNARIGDDDFGRLTLEYLSGSGNAQGIHRVAGTSSSYTIALAPPGIDRIFLHNPAANNEYCAGDLDVKNLEKSRLFHFGYPPLMRGMYSGKGGELEKIFKLAKQAGATTSCDMALPDPASEAGKAPWAEILEKILPHIDIFLPSVEEMLFMLEPAEFFKLKKKSAKTELLDILDQDVYRRLAAKLLDMGCRMTSLKAGKYGWYFKTGPEESFQGMGRARPANPGAWANRELWQPAFKVEKLASATGSGDSSIAGFLTAFLRGLSLEECMRCAVCLGWQNVQTLDAVSGIKPWEETWRMMTKGGLEQADISARTSGWKKAGDLWAAPGDRLNT